jgi:hypothetical protein
MIDVTDRADVHVRLGPLELLLGHLRALLVRRVGGAQPGLLLRVLEPNGVGGVASVRVVTVPVTSEALPSPAFQVAEGPHRLGSGGWTRTTDTAIMSRLLYL